jgi:trehalose 6-phosphate phosphatase
VIFARKPLLPDVSEPPLSPLTSSTSPTGAPPPLVGDCALFLDFDGTLAQIVDDPDSVVLPQRAAATLAQLFERLGGAVAILSGRDVRDLSSRAPPGVWRIGGHGVEACPPGSPPPKESAAPPRDLSEAIEQLAAGERGVRVERKGAILAVHYRAAPQAGASLAKALAEIVGHVEGYTLQAGKMVFEAKPLAADKGVAVAAAMAHPPFRSRTPVMVGDDVGDEGAFHVAQGMGGFGVKVGEGPSNALYRLRSTDDVWAWLEGGG